MSVAALEFAFEQAREQTLAASATLRIVELPVRVYCRSCEVVAELVRVPPLAETDLFPGAAKQMFKVGEETGTLDRQLQVAAQFFGRELEDRVRKFTAMFEPLLIIFIGAVVGFVALALVSAMYGVMGGVNT